MALANPNMLIDAVNDDNVVLATIARSDVFRAQANFRTVHVIVCVRSDIVLQQLPTKHDRSPGRLGSSVAGYLFAGESYQEAARRKLKEELSIDAPVYDCGTVTMLDQHCKKFVRVYRTTTCQRHFDFNASEIERLRLWPSSFVREALRRFPYVFTPTFVKVYERAEEA